MVICTKFDRLARNLLDFADLWNLLKRHQVNVVSVQEQLDTSSVMGEAMVMIIMVFAQLEQETTGGM